MQEIIDLTKELMRFQTVSAKPLEIKRCADFIQSYINACGIESRRLEHPRTPCILALPQKKYAPILLMTHIDVVDAPVDLFQPLKRDQKLYGRGSLDDKYAVALSMVLLKSRFKRLKECGQGQTDLPFGILVTSDEELGGFDGAKKALQQVQTDFCIVLDGGGLEKIVVKENGRVFVRLTAVGKPVSDESARLGENALENLIDDFIKLRTCFVTSAPEHPHRAVIIKNIRAEADQQIPTCAEALLEIRYTATDDMQKLFETLNNRLSGKIAVESIEPLFSNGTSSHLDLLLDISKQTRIGFEDGANDARFLSQFGIKGIIWGANGNLSRHRPDEHVDIESVFTLYRLLDEFITQAQKLKSSGK